MRICALGLVLARWLGIANIRNFLTRYTTAVGSSIYASPKWDLDLVPTAHHVHELTHVLLWSFGYAVSYVFDRHRRLFYESVCIQTSMLCFPEFQTLRYLTHQARMLVGYGVSLSMALDELQHRLQEIKLGRPHSVAARVAETYAAWRALQ